MSFEQTSLPKYLSRPELVIRQGATEVTTSRDISRGVRLLIHGPQNIFREGNRDDRKPDGKNCLFKDDHAVVVAPPGSLGRQLRSMLVN